MDPLPLISLYLITATMFCHLVDLKYKIPADYINFSGQSLKTHRYHVLFTSSFFHGNTSHLFKEVTLLLPLAIIIEQKFGAIYLLIFYFIFGIIGSILTWITDRHYYAKLFPDGKFLADYIWSRGASGNVYGLIAFTSIIFGENYLFQDINLNIHFTKNINYELNVIEYGSIWCLITNVLFHIFNQKSHFKHNPKRAYSILIIMIFCVWFLCPNKLTINTYLVIYFIHMSILRRNPAIFNKTNRANFIASDYKCHLFAALFGFMVGSLFTKYAIFSLQYIANTLPSISLMISDGYYGQYMVQQRVKKRMEERKERERQKKLAEENQTIG